MGAIIYHYFCPTCVAFCDGPEPVDRCPHCQTPLVWPERQFVDTPIVEKHRCPQCGFTVEISRIVGLGSPLPLEWELTCNRCNVTMTRRK